MNEIKSLKEFDAALKRNVAVLAFFSSNKCGICPVLKPKILELILATYPKIKMLHINMEEVPSIHGQCRIFTAPTLIVFFEGNKAFMKCKNISINKLECQSERPYELLF